MKKTIFSILLIYLTIYTPATIVAQNDKMNPIITGVPSLMIAPDAKAGAMGDAGVATAPDVYSQYWNAAKYAFASKKGGVGITYTPWLSKIVSDMALMQAVGYYKLGGANNQALSASIRYFKTGDVMAADLEGLFIEKFSPYELAIDLGYSRKLTETFSASVVLRYIRADYVSPTDNEGSPGNAFAADIAGYNESYISLFDAESLLSFGFNISNIGAKIDNSGYRKSFLPTNMRIGASLLQPLDKENTLSLSLDFNKLLVPTPPVQSTLENTAKFEQRLDNYYNRGAISSIFRSFGNAPFSEKMKEITISVGAEYMYNNVFKLRTGYFHENKDKGNRQYMTFGAGVRWKYLQLDGAYVWGTKKTNALDRTLRFSLAFDI